MGNVICVVCMYLGSGGALNHDFNIDIGISSPMGGGYMLTPVAPHH